ncbi:MAG: DinB family protein [Bacteroidota bacterium]
MLSRASQYRLWYQWERLAPMLENLNLEQIEKRWQADKWSIREHLCHMGRYQEVFLARMKQILEKDGVALGRYVAEKDPGAMQWLDMDLPKLHAQIQKDRMAMIQLVHDLKPAQWKRSGVHPKFGAMTIPEWLEFFLLHEAHHLYAIFRMSREMRAME